MDGGAAHLDPSIDTDRAARALTVGRRIGSLMLVGGAPTEDVEATIMRALDALGLPGCDVGVTFATISISWSPGPGATPFTLMHLVRARSGSFSAQAEVATLVRRLGADEIDLAAAETELTRIERGEQPYARPLLLVAPGLSAAAATILFGGSLYDAGVTLAAVLAIEPLRERLERTTIPPFFRLAIAVLLTTLLAVAIAGVLEGIDEGLVLTGALLQFLPGGALVSGIRDLIEGSIVSGSARLAEAFLLAVAVACGAAIGLSIGDGLGVRLGLSTEGTMGWPSYVAVGAAAAAAVAYAIRLGVPAFALWGVAAAAAAGWAVMLLPDLVDGVAATFVAATLVGVLGRLLARRAMAPSPLWTVPAILPLLPGLAMVEALLAQTEAARIEGLARAITIAFAVGTGVTLGDLLATGVHRVRHRVVAPAVTAAHEGIDVFVAGAQERIGSLVRSDDRPDGH
ncbi:MAG: threonine/serine exporter family protein [Chloroflexota bacterium]